VPSFPFPFYVQQQLLLVAAVARLGHHNSVRPTVHLSVTRVDQSKTVQATITKSLPSATWKTLVSGTIKLFHKFEGCPFQKEKFKSFLPSRECFPDPTAVTPHFWLDLYIHCQCQCWSCEH